MGLIESIDIKLCPRGGDFAVAYAERKILFLCTNMLGDMRYPQGKVIRHFPLSNPHICPTNPLLGGGGGLTLIGALVLFIYVLGTVSLSGGMAFTLITDLEFILTCNSSGGPATTVTWTRDSETINNIEAAKTDFVDGETAQYTHTLPGRQEGLYTCTVTNKVSPESSAELLVQSNTLQLKIVLYSVYSFPHPAPSPPTEVTVSQTGLGSLLVSWTPPPERADVTGYYIYYLYSGMLYSMIAEANGTSAIITGLIAGGTYSINVVANSTTLPSNVTTARDVTIGILDCIQLMNSECSDDISPQSQPPSPSPPPLPPSWLETLSLSPALSLYLVE